MLGSVTIGLNPALKVIEDTADYRPQNASGMVVVGLGTNDLLGGNNKTESGWLIPVSKATVEVDGKIVIKDGELIM
jgi:aminopeptidase